MEAALQTSSVNPILAAETESDLRLVAAAMEKLLGRPQTNATREKVSELRQRFDVLTRTQRGLEAESLALHVAFSERVGRNPIGGPTGDMYSEADLVRAGQILTIFGLRASER